LLINKVISEIVDDYFANVKINQNKILFPTQDDLFSQVSTAP